MRGMLGLAAALVACYSPHAATGVPCAANGACPPGQTCDMAMVPATCVSSAPGGDARGDGLVGDGGPTACTTSAGCPAASPVCDMTTHTCRGCGADTECDAGVCTEYNGQCVSESNVLFVAPAATGSCTRASPCTFATAASMLSQPRHTICVADGTYADPLKIPAISLNGTIVVSGVDRSAYGATLHPSSLGVALQSDSPTPVVVEGLTITGGSSDGMFAKGPLTASHLDVGGNAGRGLTYSPNGTLPLVVLDSVFHGNSSDGLNIQAGTFEMRRSVVADNQSAGVRISRAATTIVSSMIIHNGTPTSNNPAVQFLNTTVPPVLAFDTIANNLSATGLPAAVQCDTQMAFDSSIFIDNGPAGSPQIGILCSATYSLFPIDANGPPGGAGNVAGAAGFADEPTGNYHITPSSAARGAGNPAGTVTDDIDGEGRPQGMIDTGADEIP